MPLRSRNASSVSPTIATTVYAPRMRSMQDATASCRVAARAVAISFVITSVSEVAENRQPWASSSARSTGALTRLPLCASASVPQRVVSRNGCAFASRAPPMVE